MRILWKLAMSTAIFVSTTALASLCGFLPGLPSAPEGFLVPIPEDLDADFPEGSDPVEILETIDHPQRVLCWTAAGLKLEDGRILAPPGVAELPLHSELLSAVTSNGVEVDLDTGRVYGLLRIWHNYCGNDRTRNHIARIDIAHLLEFLSLRGKYDGACDRVAPEGWEVRCFWAYQNQREAAKSSEK